MVITNVLAISIPIPVASISAILSTLCVERRAAEVTASSAFWFLRAPLFYNSGDVSKVLVFVPPKHKRLCAARQMATNGCRRTRQGFFEQPGDEAAELRKAATASSTVRSCL